MFKIILLFFLFTNLAFSQNETFAKAKEVCDCFYNLEKDNATKNYHIKVFNDCAGNEFQKADSLLIHELIFYCEAYNYYFEMYRFEEMIVKVAENVKEQISPNYITQDVNSFKSNAKLFSIQQIQNYIPQLLLKFQLEKANELVELWIALAPNDALAYFYRGYIYEYWRDFDFAYKSYYNFKKLSQNYKLGNQLISFVLLLEEDEDEEDEQM